MDENIVSKPSDDLPKSIIVILVVLAVAISVLGTFTVLSEMNRLNSAPVYKGTPVQTAKVTLTVIDPNSNADNAVSKATGRVTLTVIDRPEE